MDIFTVAKNKEKFEVGNLSTAKTQLRAGQLPRAILYQKNPLENKQFSQLQRISVVSSLLEGNCFLFFFSLVSFFPRLTHFTSLATEVVLILLSFLHDFQPLFRPRTSGNKIDHTGYLKCKQREDMEDIWLSDIYLSEVTLTNTDSNTSLTLNLFRTMSEKATWSQKDLGNVWKHTSI